MIDIRKAYSYFRNMHGLRNKPSPKGWYSFNCPFCIDAIKMKRKMAVHFDYEFVKCWLCEWRGTIVDFVMEVESKDYLEAKEYINSFEATAIDMELVDTIRQREVSKIEMPFGYKTILEGAGILEERARQYLVKRGFNLTALDSMGIGYCLDHVEKFEEDYFGYIIIPFKKHGKLAYYIGRDFMNRNSKYKYKNPSADKFGVGKGELFFNEDALELYDEVELVEGWACALTLGRQCMASLGWALSDRQRQLIISSKIKRLVIIPDKGFYTQALKTASKFIDEINTYVVNFDVPELANYGSDVNEVGKERVRNYIDAHYTPLTLGKIMELIT